MSAEPDLCNPNEINNFRNKAVWNNTAGAVTFNNSTGREYVSIAHKGGASIVLANQSTSEFNPNNKQSLTNGDSYETVKGSKYLIAQNYEERIHGDITILTGDTKLFNTPLLDKYMELQSKLASAKSSPEVLQPGYGNVTGVKHAGVGASPDPVSGSTQDKPYKSNAVHDKMQDLLKEHQKQITPYEQLMGEGGSIKLLSGKDILIQGGAAAANFDTAFINPHGRKVNLKYEYDGDRKVTLKETHAMYIEEKDTSSHIPFGNVHIKAGNQLDLGAGAAGVQINSNGSVKISSHSVASINGAQVNIGGSSGGASTGAVYITSGDIVEIEAPKVHIQSRGGHVFIDPGLSVKGNTIIKGDLVVDKNLFVLGNIECKGTIHAIKDISTDASMYAMKNIKADGNITAGGTMHAKKNITSDADIIASGISLRRHFHMEQGDGSPTSKPR